MTTRILLTRHGHVAWIAPERFRGRAELPLTPLGEKQIRALGACVAAHWKPDAIYTSPLSRCVLTAEAVARATQAGVSPMQEMVDIDYGQWQGLTHEEVRMRWPEEMRLWQEAPDLATLPGGESLTAVLVRAVGVLQQILRKHRDQTVVLVGHDSINRVLLLRMLGLPLSNYWHIKQAPCCINEIVVDGHDFIFHRMNETGHLDELD